MEKWSQSRFFFFICVLGQHKEMKGGHLTGLEKKQGAFAVQMVVASGVGVC